MKVYVLMEDTAASDQFACEHGLSLFLETGGKKILFDAGKSGLFLKNAEHLGVDVLGTDLAILSHGHNDHGGGLPIFLEANQKAKVYLQRRAFEEHFSRLADGTAASIGISPELEENPRVVKVDGDNRIDENLLLFSSVTSRRFWSRSNDALLIRGSTEYAKDPFFHEQSLLISENGKKILIAGCAHRGVVNILERAMELAGGPINAVIGGFHLSNPRAGGCEPAETVLGIAEILLSFPTVYYTCHCTGKQAMEQLKNKMGDRVKEIAAGDVFEV